MATGNAILDNTETTTLHITEAEAERLLDALQPNDIVKGDPLIDRLNQARHDLEWNRIERGES